MDSVLIPSDPSEMEACKWMYFFLKSGLDYRVLLLEYFHILMTRKYLASPAGYSWLESLSNSVFERRTSIGSGLFASLGSGLVETLG